MSEQKWRVEVSGKLATASLLPRHLPRFDVTLDSEGQAYVSHPDLEPLTRVQEVRARALQLVDKANGALAVAMIAPPSLMLGSRICEHIGGGEIVFHRFALEEGFARPAAKEAAPAEEGRTLAERALALANINRNFGAAIARMRAAEDNVPELAEVFELVHIAICGEDADRMALAEKGWATTEELMTFHNLVQARKQPQAKTNRLSPSMARALVRRLLVRWADRDMPS